MIASNHLHQFRSFQTHQNLFHFLFSLLFNSVHINLIFIFINLLVIKLIFISILIAFIPFYLHSQSLLSQFKAIWKDVHGKVLHMNFSFSFKIHYRVIHLTIYVLLTFKLIIINFKLVFEPSSRLIADLLFSFYVPLLFELPLQVEIWQSLHRHLLTILNLWFPLKFF